MTDSVPALAASKLAARPCYWGGGRRLSAAPGSGERRVSPRLRLAAAGEDRRSPRRAVRATSTRCRGPQAPPDGLALPPGDCQTCERLKIKNLPSKSH